MSFSMKRSQCDEAKRLFFADHKGCELHHIFNKHFHRLKACRAFMAPMPKAKGAANHHDGTAEIRMKMRDDRRELFAAFGTANVQNLDQHSCWFAACLYANETCPLYRRACAKDAEEMAKIK